MFTGFARYSAISMFIDFCSAQEQVPGTFPNGQALWIHDRGDRFLYCGSDGHWYVGDEEEQDANFCCESGYIRQIPHRIGLQLVSQIKRLGR